jgi:hypothetical protein
MENIDPKRTIELLGELEQLGFGDNAFQRLHHFWQHSESNPQRHHKIGAHRGHCAELAQRGSRFHIGGNNARTQHRLEIVLACYRRYRSDTAAFPHLADASVDSIPFLPLRTAP